MSMLDSTRLLGALDAALSAAVAYRGATSPNPPVGAAALDADGRVLSIQAHPKAGALHAEPRVIEHCRSLGILEKVHTLVVTLEPCNHIGRTPPCTQAIVNSGIRRLAYAVKDSNPKVEGHGASRLRDQGLEIACLEEMFAEAPEILRARDLIAPFSKWAKTGIPWVTLKQAVNETGSMIPPPGTKTFTRESSLRIAHELRRRADAVLTGSGTVLADWPELTVRHVIDHSDKRRWLVILDRRGRVPDEFLSQARANGFDVKVEIAIDGALEFLGAQGCHEVLVEAGPQVLESFLRSGLWDSHVLIRRGSIRDEVLETRRLAANPADIAALIRD